jgi:hypothetical protein
MTDVQQRGASTCDVIAALAGLAHVGYDFDHRINYVGPTSAETPQDGDGLIVVRWHDLRATLNDLAIL